MTPTLLTSDAKEALRKTVRGLRGRLIDQLTEAARGEYRLDVALAKAQLPEARRCRRERLEAWIDEQARSARKPKDRKAGKGADAELRQRFLQQAAKEAAHTLLNRLVLVRILEHHGVLRPAVVTGGWSSPAYEQEFVHYAGPLATDDTRGYRALLDAVFAELAVDLPGLFGPVGLTPLFPVPAAVLREVIDALNDPTLASAWGDDTTLGWVYQYWNDPEREQLDAKIAGGGKIEPHEIASKTQMFTERYMVEWLLQNSLGLTWLAICRKPENAWTPEAEAVLPVLEARRAAWRAKREAGEVALDALMPVEPGIESAWKYYVEQPIPEDAVAKAPPSIREVRLLDPACGSGHFLVIAFGLLADLYREEARHRGEAWSDEEIAESILANNLHGIDIDPRAIQIAAAALALRARLFAPEARLSRMNLVAPSLRLGDLPEDDPALLELCRELEREAGIAEALTRKLVKGIAGVDYLGSLLKVDEAIREALNEATRQIERGKAGQGDLFRGFAVQREELSFDAAREAVVEKLERFLEAHSASEDLGLRLHGEQLASGVRFVRLAKEGSYDVVVGNPPYQGLSKTAQFEYVAKHYPRGKADLYAAFLERGLELVREGGISALLTMRGWMFVKQYKEVREHLLRTCDLRALVDFDSGAFEEVSAAQVVLSVACSVFRRDSLKSSAVALRPTPMDDRASAGMTSRKRAGLLAQTGRCKFDPKGFEVIEGAPIVYWWTKEFLDRYSNAPKLGKTHKVRKGVCTCNDPRYVRKAHEVIRARTLTIRCDEPKNWNQHAQRWSPTIMGGDGLEWFEPLRDVALWEHRGLEMKTDIEHAYGVVTKRIQSESLYMESGVAFAMIGSHFGARMHRWRSIFGNMGSSVFPIDRAAVTCTMNTGVARKILASLNPGVHFEVGDVNRLPIFPVANADEIFATVERAFTEHESHREPSVEFRRPGPSPWRHAQDWAQLAVDRPEGAPLPPYEPVHDPPAPEAPVSFALGVALGRFDAGGNGLLDAAPPDALPAGILFVGPSDHLPDSLPHPASAPLLGAWAEHQRSICTGKEQPLRDWLRKDFFTYHKALYENRPIYFPLSSDKRSFVAWVSIHRWTDSTLQTLLADHLHPLQRKLDGEIADLAQARASSDKKTAIAAEKQYATVKRLRDELAGFIEAVSQCAERGAPPTDPACPPRAADATFRMDLDDGVMINSAALWPLLAPQWSDPKKWWKQLCLADGRKDYDWSHLARRYFPARVDEKCRKDPSLAVAHGCFWQDHPAKAYAWELRLKDEIRPDFTLDEPGSDGHRARFLLEHAAEARALEAAEHKRRERKAAKAEADEPGELDAGEAEDEEAG
ncbi:BREX-6 system adenine-specific DNA-methyltransferase PglX [Sorangium sp. So ce1014]|uniref:BREX-6 system adenine-specific DNA-methyltransferase PglX n=1 Tax=Sorangium sp. So ce1014 TaxID=3133326 RepID=UPI003F6263EF